MSEARPLAWFCVRAEGRREHLAAFNLARRTQVEVFAPRIRVRRETRTGRIDTLTEPLFPGYLFARFKYPEQVRHVVSTAGVLGLVTFGGPPPPLADEAISFLRKHTEGRGPAPASPVFEEGDWVRIAGGCFRGTTGRVREFDARHARVRVLLSLLGHEVEISVPAAQVIVQSGFSAHTPAELRNESEGALSATI
jgi:transcriptional antiterminator RfaH